ncbi:MAG: hypothetical protein RL033_6817 [Pseudomonadota bacterium]
MEQRLTRQACVVRHLAFEDLGTFEPLLAARGYDVTIMEAGVDELLEPMVRSDLVIVLGGPIGVYEHDKYPFLVDELRALQVRLAQRKPTLGICLGAQLMAAALGASVRPGGQKELGWEPITLTSAGMDSCLRALGSQPVLHWHGDTFDIPPGAERLASTRAYENQAFSLGPNVLALQFHPEVDTDRFEQWLIGHAVELGVAGVDISVLRASVKQGGPSLRNASSRVLAHWLEQLRW